MFVILLCAGSAVQAQQKTEAKPIQGFWVIESNTHSPKKQIVKFYNQEQQLLYQENYDYKVLKCTKKTVQQMLDSSLVAVLKSDFNLVEATRLANVIHRK